MRKQKLKGLWIPAEILLNNDLSDKEKIISSMILYLSDETGSCFASNKYIASIVNVTSDRVSKIVSSLKEKGYVDVNLKYKIDTKEILKDMKLEIPDVPDISDININRLSKKRDEKILEKIIKPKDDVIQSLYKDNIDLHRELSRQEKIIEEAEKYQKERDSIIADNEEMHKQVESIKTEYKEKEFNIEWKYKSKIKGLEKENNHLHRVVDKFYETVEKFIDWICQKFGIGESKELVREFEKETNMYIDPEKQLKKEEREKRMGFGNIRANKFMGDL